jgi:hypothetical protein
MSKNDSPVVENKGGALRFLSYFTNVLGAISALTLVLPLLPILPELGRKTQIMAIVMSLLFLMGVYMSKRALWEGELRKSVRGASGSSMRFTAMLILFASLAAGFFLAADGVGLIKEWLPGALTTRFIAPILQVGVFSGLTLAFSIFAALDYMAGQERAGAYQRPPHLREEVDLPDLAADLLRTNLQIPTGTAWKINYRERTPGGGVKLIISWTEEIERTTSQGESVKLLQEKKFAVDLDVKGRILSFRESAG